MKHVKTLFLAFTLMFVLATAALAGETNCPPLPPCVPGELSSPPCQSMSDASSLPEELLTPPAASVVDVTDLTEAVMWALSLF